MIQITWGINNIKDISKMFANEVNIIKKRYFNNLIGKLKISIYQKLKLFVYDIFDNGGMSIITFSNKKQ